MYACVYQYWFVLICENWVFHIFICHNDLKLVISLQISQNIFLSINWSIIIITIITLIITITIIHEVAGSIPGTSTILNMV